MSLQKLSYEDLHMITAKKVREADEIRITKIVNVIHNQVITTAELGYQRLKWESNYDYYQYKDIVLAANRLRILFPDATVKQKRGHIITVEWC